MSRLPLLVLLFPLACGAPASKGPPASACPKSDAQPGDVKVVASGLRGTEGIAFSPAGKLYVAAGPSIFEVKPDGSHTLVASVPKSVGMAWWGDALYVAAGDDGSNSPLPPCDPGGHGAVWKVTGDGQASVFAKGIVAPNFLAVTPWNTLLVSDDCTANRRILELDAEGRETTWLDDIPSPNGLAFDAAGTTFYAATTWLDEPPVWKLAVDAAHEPGTPTPLATFDGGSAPDGLTIDADGAVYVSLNPKAEIHRISPDGKEELFAEGVTTTASLAFGDGPGFDRCTIYSTSLFGDDLYSIYVGRPGLALRR